MIPSFSSPHIKRLTSLFQLSKVNDGASRIFFSTSTSTSSVSLMTIVWIVGAVANVGVVKVIP